MAKNYSKSLISPKMKKGIKFIETALDIKFKGSTFEEASKFIEDNLDKAHNVDIRTKIKPSPKMLKVISFIEDTLNIDFEGITMAEASQFIEDHLEEAKQKQQYFREHRSSV